MYPPAAVRGTRDTAIVTFVSRGTEGEAWRQGQGACNHPVFLHVDGCRFQLEVDGAPLALIRAVSGQEPAKASMPSSQRAHKHVFVGFDDLLHAETASLRIGIASADGVPLVGPYVKHRHPLRAAVDEKCPLVGVLAHQRRAELLKTGLQAGEHGVRQRHQRVDADIVCAFHPRHLAHIGRIAHLRTQIMPFSTAHTIGRRPTNYASSTRLPRSNPP